ncbi:MAG: ATP-binding protein [Desulfobulbus sp.]
MQNSPEKNTPTNISTIRHSLRIFIPAALLILSSIFWIYKREQQNHINSLTQKELIAADIGKELIHNCIDPILEDLSFLTSITNVFFAQHLNEKKTQPFHLLEQTFLAFAESHPLYDQIRLLDTHGWERIRVNNAPNGPLLVEAGELQDKHQRYYFKDSYKLDLHQTYISPLDLNIEYGQIEQPLKPMIRFGQVTVDPSGKKLGIVLINYKARTLLDTLGKWGNRQAGKFMLLNRDGYWLFGKPGQEWGFMYSDRLKQTLKQEEPKLWSSIINGMESGQTMHHNGLYTHTTVRPLHAGIISSTGSASATGNSQGAIATTDYFWKIVSLVPQELIARSLFNLRQQTLGGAAVLLLILALFSYFLAKAQLRRDAAAKALRKANEKLEEMVERRTSQLQIQNNQLVEEINTRKITEQALRDSEYKYATLLETMREGLVVIDTQGIITYCNARLGEMLGYSVEELATHPLTTFLLEDEKDIFLRQQLDHKKNGIVSPYEITWQKKDGGTLLSSVSPALLQDKHGAIIGSFGVITDITAGREAELQKQTLENQLQQTQKMEALGTLAGGIAHDFNNILAAIIGYAELATTQAEQGTPVAKALQVILSAGDRAAKLVQQILAFSRQTNQAKQPLEIVPIIKEAMKLIRAATSSSIAIELDLKQEVGQIMADPTQIHQIVMNICTNACYAMAREGGTLRLAIERVPLDEQEAFALHVQSGDFVRLTISDTGPGMQPDVMRRIFEPFFTTKEIGKGTGLGLSVVHAIVTDLSGDIHVESEAGQGTTFIIHLPITQQLTAPQAVISENILYGNSEHLIWVDDEEPLMTMGCQILTSLGYKATGFTDPVQCLDELRRNHRQYQLIISDFNMPKLNGLALLEQTRAMGIAIPFVLCSGFSEEITTENAQEKGLHQYLMKPVRKYDVALAVYTALHTTTPEPAI